MQTKEYNLIRLLQFGAIRSKLAEMAMNCYADESASYRAAKDIEDRITAREAEGCTRLN
jgi:alkylation response protein AidB-like acyl-CoA dehydrogenase